MEVLVEQPALLLLVANQVHGLQQQLEGLQTALVGWVAAEEADSVEARTWHRLGSAEPTAAAAQAGVGGGGVAGEVQQLVVRAPWLLAEHPAAVVRRLEVLGGVLNCTPQQQRRGLWQGVVLLPELLRLDLTGANRVLKTLTGLLGCSVAEVKQALVAPPSVATPGWPSLPLRQERGGAAAAGVGSSSSGMDGGGQGKVTPLGLLLLERSRVHAAYEELQQAAVGKGMQGEQLKQMLLQHLDRLLRH
jgi:hypothetical protein